MIYLELLLLSFVLSVVCAVSLIGIGVQQQSLRRVGLGLAKLSVIAPFAVTFVPRGYATAVLLGGWLLGGFLVALVVE